MGINQADGAVGGSGIWIYLFGEPVGAEAGAVPGQSRPSISPAEEGVGLQNPARDR